MEDYVRDAPREASNRTLYLKDVPEDEEQPVPQIQLTPPTGVKEEVYEDASPRADPLPETTPSPAPPVEPIGDLLVGIFFEQSPKRTCLLLSCHSGLWFIILCFLGISWQVVC
jgi:hypothetical protein